MHAGSGRTRGTIAPPFGLAPNASARNLLRLLLEKSEEAGRGVDRQLAGEGEQVSIAGNQHRALGSGQGKQVVVSWVDRANRWRPLWIRHDRRGAGQPLKDRLGLVGGDPPTQLRVGRSEEHTSELQ